MSLFGILEAYILTGVVGNFAYDKVRGIISRKFQKRPVELFLEAIQETIQASEKGLEYFTRDGEVNFHRDKLLSLVYSSKVKELPLNLDNETKLLTELAKVFCQHQILEIGGHQLSDERYATVVQDILVRSKQRFRQKLSQDQVAFNEILFAEIDNQTSRQNEILRHSREIPEIHAGIRSLQESISQLPQTNQETEVEGPPIIQPQKITSLYDAKPETNTLAPQNNEYETITLDSLFSIDYLSPLQDEMENKGFINRLHVVESIRNTLGKQKIVCLLGEPGIGKTFLLGLIGGEVTPQ